MRNTPAEQRGAWATFAKAAREGARMSQTALARELGVERTTIWRWETGKQKPENAGMVAKFADAVGIDLEEALAAAGMRPGVEPRREPTREYDEELEMILAAPADDQTKKMMIEYLFQRREEDKRRRMQDMKFIIDPRRRKDTA